MLMERIEVRLNERARELELTIEKRVQASQAALVAKARQDGRTNSSHRSRKRTRRSAHFDDVLLGN
jgi:hypothetical protein